MFIADDKTQSIKRCELSFFIITVGGSNFLGPNCKQSHQAYNFHIL